MKKSRIALICLATLASALSLTSCGESAKKFDAKYTSSAYSSIAAMGWYTVNNYDLDTYTDNSFVLTTTTDIFGAVEGGFETKGLRKVTVAGTFTSVAASDEVEGDFTLTLSAASRIYVAQWGKAWGRNTDIMGTGILDTENWTDDMNDGGDNGVCHYVPADGSAASKEAFLASDYGVSKTVTVQDPRKNTADATLAFKIVALPAKVA